MKNILITGAGSYIGTSFERYIVENFGTEYTVDTVDMTDGSWREKDFSGYDSIFHVAGIAHRKETEENAQLYYDVNTSLTAEVAKKAKAEGVVQFIFLSSMSVYGKETGVITRDTVPSPKSNYGKSKLLAEEELGALADDSFGVCIVRPPMVYGKDCKGNFQTVIKIVKKLPVFPRVKNRRSMIYIDNLSCFIKMCIDKNICGVHLPQNREYMNTQDMARTIARGLGVKRYFSFLLGLGVIICRPALAIMQKAFGTLIYEDTEEFDFRYCLVENTESVERSV